MIDYTSDTNTPEPERYCTRCNKILKASRLNFSPKSSGVFHLDCKCKLCASRISRDRYRNSEEHRERVKLIARDRYANDTDFRQKTKTRVRERTKLKRNTDPIFSERLRQENRNRHHTEHGRSLRRVATQRYRARKGGAVGTYTATDIEIQYQSQKKKCWHCGDDLNGVFHVDHLIPLSKGGTNWPNNLVCSCKNCNLSKGAKLTQEWNGRLF